MKKTYNKGVTLFYNNVSDFAVLAEGIFKIIFVSSARKSGDVDLRVLGSGHFRKFFCEYLILNFISAVLSSNHPHFIIKTFIYQKICSKPVVFVF